MPRLNITEDEITTYLEQLEATPAQIAQITAGLDEPMLATAPSSRAWSLVAVLAHLRACSELWTHNIYAMLSADSPELPLLDERRWARYVRYDESSFTDSLRAFTIARNELVHALRAATAEDWQRTATIGGRNHSVATQVRRLTSHEAEHLEQISTLAASHRAP